MIPENIKSEEIDWKATQQEQQLTEILKKSEKDFDLSDTEKNKNIPEIFTKLEQNMKEIQKNIDWRKKNSIIQAGYWSYDFRHPYYKQLYYIIYYNIGYKIYYQAKKNTDYFPVI